MSAVPTVCAAEAPCKCCRALASLFSHRGLQRMLATLVLHFGSFNNGIHFAFRNVPDFARHFIQTR